MGDEINMKSVFFKMETGFNYSPNKLIPVNDEYTFKGSDNSLGSFSKTNIFIGENNSGKSRFLRHLFSGEYYSISNEEINKLYDTLKHNIAHPQKFEEKSALDKFNFLYSETKNEHTPYTNRGNSFFSHLENLSCCIKPQQKHYFPTIRGVKDYKYILDGKLKSFLKSATSIQNKDAINHFISLLNLEKEGLEAFDVYREIIVHEYFSHNNIKSTLNVVTGGNLYGTIKSMLLGDEKERNLISEFQSFLQNNFFNDYGKVQLIPNETKKVLYVKIGSDERAIYDWGDGTQQLIVLLFTLFVHKDEKDNMFFIEEPEIYLHPGILRKLIEVINSDAFPNHQYFITTHSNIILDTSADSNISMSIFKFKKAKESSSDKTQFTIEQCNNGDISLLNELGVRNSSIFMSNCSIWVEGITDRLYLKHFLGLYYKKQGITKSFRENIDYTFIEYGGNNIVHFNFDPSDSEDSINAKYINNRIFLIADNDNTANGSKKEKRKEHLREVLGDNFYELPVTEIENLLSQNTIAQILKKQNPKHTIFIDKKFEKIKNYKTKKIGRFIDDLFKDSDLRKYSGESGTIKNKLDFCQTAIELISDFDELTDEAKALVERIINFISKNN